MYMSGDDARWLISIWPIWYATVDISIQSENDIFPGLALSTGYAQSLRSPHLITQSARNIFHFFQFFLSHFFPFFSAKLLYISYLLFLHAKQFFFAFFHHGTSKDSHRFGWYVVDATFDFVINQLSRILSLAYTLAGDSPPTPKGSLRERRPRF